MLLLLLIAGLPVNGRWHCLEPNVSKLEVIILPPPSQGREFYDCAGSVVGLAAVGIWYAVVCFATARWHRHPGVCERP